LVAWRYKEVRLDLASDDKQKEAKSALRDRLINTEKKKNATGTSDEEIERIVDNKMKQIDKVRDYLIKNIGDGIKLEAQTKIGENTLIGFANVNHGNYSKGDLIVNPFTFFTDNGTSWDQAIEGSSSRAKAALSPGLQLLHELVHYTEKHIVDGSSTPLQFDIMANDEEDVIKDVDKAVKELSDWIAPRVWYGKGKTVDSQGRGQTADQGSPGQIYVLDPNGINYNITYTDLQGKEWIKWPSKTQLSSGKK
jgi:hypothetical protein